MRLITCAAALMLGACGNLPVTGDGVVAPEVTVPPELTLEQGQSRQLTARALDASGQEVAVAILWQTPDETLTVDEATGVVTGVAESGTGRVQAMVGTLRSDLITFTLLPAAGP